MSNSNVLSQSATSIAVCATEADWQFDASAKRCSERQAKGLTQSKHMCNRQKLIAAMCAEYRSHFPAIYGKSERLPSDVFEKIEHAADTEILSLLALIHPGNAQSVRRAFAHKARDRKFVLRTVATGEDDISLKEQHLACQLALTQANKRLSDLMVKPTPDYDREKQVKTQIIELELTLQFIEGEMKHQAKLSVELTK